MQKALDIVTALLEKGGGGGGDALVVDYELCDAVYARAEIQGASSVHLWLGAGVMIEYPLQEAQVGGWVGG